MKRKPVKLNVDETYKQTDFYRRFQKNINREMKDHKYSSEFTLDANKRYSDDPLEERYMIDKVADEEYLVFIVSLVKVAMAMDESKLFEKVKMNIELRPDSLDSFSKVDSFFLSVLANVVMVILFLGIMYALFPVLRSTVFLMQKKIGKEVVNGG